MKRFLLATGLAFVLMSTACSRNEETADTIVEETPATAPAPAPERRVVRQRESEPARVTPEVSRDRSQGDHDPSQQIPRFRGELSDRGYGMAMIIDGSSPQAFMNSLELIAAESSDGQMRAFYSALDHYRMYRTAYPDLESFYRSIDGMTGEDLISQIRAARDGRR